MECDTDSLYLAIARSTIDKCVKSEKVKVWYKKKYNYFASDSHEMMEFNGQKITKEQYEKRTPGLYKLEYSGDGMVCLNSKVYHIWGRDNKGNKIFKTSSKGMQRRNNLIRQKFFGCLIGKDGTQS